MHGITRLFALGFATCAGTYMAASPAESADTTPSVITVTAAPAAQLTSVELLDCSTRLEKVWFYSKAVDQEDERLVRLKQVIDADKTTLEMEQAQLDTRQASAVSRYSDRVVDHSRRLQEYNRQVDRFNTAIDAYNVLVADFRDRCANRTYEQTRLDELSQPARQAIEAASQPSASGPKLVPVSRTDVPERTALTE